jgi:hypothetical protein
MHTLLLFIVCICFYHTHGANIAFDPSKEAYCLTENGGCAFNNASIWINNTVPSTNDYVVISGSGTSSSPLLVEFPVGYVVELQSLVIESASVALNSNSSLEVASIDLRLTTLLSVLNGSSLQGQGDDSNFTLSATAALHVQGTMNWYSFTLNSGN